MQTILKAAIAHNGLSVIDVVSPCVTFNDHLGSTKSYTYMKDHDEPLHAVDFVPFYDDMVVEIEDGTVQDIQMGDGSTLRIHKLGKEHDPTDKLAALKLIHETESTEDVLTGVLYVNSKAENFMDMLNLVDQPLGTQPQAMTRPPREVLEKVMEELR